MPRRDSRGRWTSLGGANAYASPRDIGRLVKVTGNRVRGHGLLGRVVSTDSTGAFSVIRTGSGRMRSYHTSDLSVRRRAR